MFAATKIHYYERTVRKLFKISCITLMVFVVNCWLGGWMDGWLVVWMDGCIDGWMGGEIDVSMDGWIDGRADGWIYG
jgi:hypothetical protein